MTYASDEDIEILRKYFSDADFTAALDDPAPGIFDRNSWTKWNERYGRAPISPLPRRQIPGVDPATVPDFFPQNLETCNVTIASGQAKFGERVTRLLDRLHCTALGYCMVTLNAHHFRLIPGLSVVQL